MSNFIDFFLSFIYFIYLFIYYVVSNVAILFICILNIFYDGEINTYMHTYRYVS